MRAKTEQPRLTGDNYKLCARQMPRPSASRQPAFLPARCTRICGLFPPLAYEKSPRKSWQKVKGTISFPKQNSKNDGDSWLTCKTSAIKAISINKSSNILDAIPESYKCMIKGNKIMMLWWQPCSLACLCSFLAVQHTCLQPHPPRCPFSLNHYAAFSTNVRGKWTGDLEMHSSLFSPCCLFPASVCSQAKFSIEVSA